MSSQSISPGQFDLKHFAKKTSGISPIRNKSLCKISEHLQHQFDSFHVSFDILLGLLAFVQLYRARCETQWLISNLWIFAAIRTLSSNKNGASDFSLTPFFIVPKCKPICFGKNSSARSLRFEFFMRKNKPTND